MNASEIRKQLTRGLSSLGLEAGDTVLVHSSLRSLGDFSCKAEIVTDSILNCIGANGTLLVPALSYETVNKVNNLFDVKRTPSCVGGMSEFFRTTKGVLRSVHPTHSVCGFGPLAETLLQSHIQCNTPCGKNSPYQKLKEHGGKILFLGCGLRPNTSMHAVEELSEPPYLFGDYVRYRVILENGDNRYMTVLRHNFKGVLQRYERISGIVTNRGLVFGNVFNAECHLLDAATMWKEAHKVLLKDPLFFVDQK
ncbi:aminoglycoside 3-N-acetyltransferase [Chitinispirillum alkaliphilum]|nr:aminoglycoside 3-N-acetyltransferase [Chitinispirillum alkaliphilum]